MIQTTNYLGSATVLNTGMVPGHVEVLLPNGDGVSARLALAVPYQPAVGDEVLVIAQETDNLFVIGVLKGSGATTLKVPGDLNIEAPNGAIILSASKNMNLKSKQILETSAPRIVLRSGRLDVLTGKFVQKVENVYQWVSELCQIKSRRFRTVVDEGFLVKAGRTHLKSNGNCSINGKTIHLG
ncbi:MAG: DUF3540 domain-containing protein [Nitrospira sp.]|nr:DUF3540 domain-containing protein [Nitrospira sp.]